MLRITEVDRQNKSVTIERDPIGQLKLHKRYCNAMLTEVGDQQYQITYIARDKFDSMRLPCWELVNLWYQIGELLDVDRDDARYLLEQKFWKKEE